MWKGGHLTPRKGEIEARDAESGGVAVGSLSAPARRRAAAADRVRPLGNGRYELKALIDAECQRGLEQLASLLSDMDPRMTVGQLVGRLVREPLDRHDPSRRRPRTGSRPAVSATSTAQTGPGCDGNAAPAPKSR